MESNFAEDVVDAVKDSKSVRVAVDRTKKVLDETKAYKDYIGAVDLQGPSNVPFLLYFATGMFTAVFWWFIINNYTPKLIIPTAFSTLFFLFVFFINLILNIVVRLSNPRRCTAVVDAVVPSSFSSGPKGPYLCAYMHIEETNESFRYETNRYRSWLSEGDRFPILVAHKLWVFEKPFPKRHLI